MVVVTVRFAANVSITVPVVMDIELQTPAVPVIVGWFANEGIATSSETTGTWPRVQLVTVFHAVVPPFHVLVTAKAFKLTNANAIK